MVARTPQAAVSWGLSLVVIPLVAIPVYWIFGESRLKGYHQATETPNERLQASARQLQEASRPFAASLGDQFQDAERISMALGGTRPVRGNKLELLIDGASAFDRMFEEIDSAEVFVVVQFYIVKADGLGNELRRHLEMAVARGVRCFLLYDDIGSKGLDRSWVEGLRRKGVHVASFITNRQRGRKFQFNFRNHRKLVVVDGRIAFLGGLNAADEYLGKGPLGSWRDTHVAVEGPAVAQQLIPFLEDWHYAAHEVPELPVDPQLRGEQVVLPFASGPTGPWHVAQAVYHEIIHDARDRLWIVSPYLVPDLPTRSALAFAALRGVDVRILLPGKPDHILPWLTSFTLYPQLQEAGVRVWRQKEGFMHQKVLLADSKLAVVGSINLDSRSFGINFEAAIASDDQRFAHQVEVMLENDFENSREEDLSSFASSPFFNRLKCRLASLLSPEQ